METAMPLPVAFHDQDGHKCVHQLASLHPDMWHNDIHTDIWLPFAYRLIEKEGNR
jgi:hypothetical protein